MVILIHRYTSVDNQKNNFALKNVRKTFLVKRLANIYIIFGNNSVKLVIYC